MEIGKLNCVSVHKAQCAYTSSGKIYRSWAAQATHTYDEYFSLP